MLEKFSDFEKAGYLKETGDFVFTVDNCNMSLSSKGDPMAVFDVSCDAGISKLYMSLAQTARWKYNQFIAACLNLTPEQRRDPNYMVDYETIGQTLVGKQFIGTVTTSTREVSVKKAKDDGTFEDAVETRVNYNISKFISAETPF